MENTLKNLKDSNIKRIMGHGWMVEFDVDYSAAWVVSTYNNKEYKYNISNLHKALKHAGREDLIIERSKQDRLNELYCELELALEMENSCERDYGSSEISKEIEMLEA